MESYLDESTLVRVQSLMGNEWILTHYKTLVHMENSGCAAMFELDKVQDLERIHGLFCRVPQTLKEVHKVMIDRICAAGHEILNDPEEVRHPVSRVLTLLQLRARRARPNADLSSAGNGKR